MSNLESQNEENLEVEGESTTSPVKKRAKIFGSDDEDDEHDDSETTQANNVNLEVEGESATSPVKKRAKIFESDDEDDEHDDLETTQANNVNLEVESESTTSPVKKRAKIFGSDDEDDEHDDLETTQANNVNLEVEGEPEEPPAENVGKLMANIFGESSDDDTDEEGSRTEIKENQEGTQTDEDEPKFLRVENVDSDREEDRGQEWDFDVMMRQKKAERRHKRKSKDGSVNLLSDADDLVKAIVDEMTDAANEDRQSNMDKRPAIQKRKMLKAVRSTLLRMDLFEALLDNGMMSAISDWLAPLPDKSLPALEVRSTLLKILEGYPRLEQGILKQSGLGKAVMFLFKHPKELRENKIIASKLIREWSRPIFQLDTDFRSLGREDRLARDLAQLPQSKRLKLQLDEDGQPTSSLKSPSNSQSSKKSHSNSTSGPSGAEEDPNSIKTLRPGDPGFINRARVPKPSTKDYVIRPKSQVEGRFQGPSKSSKTSRLDRAQREFLARNKSSQAKRAVGVSIEGRKMDI